MIESSRSLHESLVELLPDAILVLDESNGRFVLTNAAAERLFEMPRAQLTRLSLRDLVRPWDLGQLDHVEAALHNGKAMDVWRRMIAAQGGDPDAPLPVAKETHVVTAPQGGMLVRQDALPFGIAAWRLGAGRARPQDPVQHAAGIDLHVKPGDTVVAGQPLFTLSADEPERFARALEALEGSWQVGEPSDLVDTGPLIADRID